jgi:hypothetical protein
MDGKVAMSWNTFRKEFEQLADKEKAFVRETRKDRILRAYCDYSEHPEISFEEGAPEQGPYCLLKAPEIGLWKYGPAINEKFLEAFRNRAARAGVVLDTRRDTEPDYCWLDRLYRFLRETKSKFIFFRPATDSELLSAAGWPEKSIKAYLEQEAKANTATINHLCEASEMFCSWLERQALKQSNVVGPRDAQHIKRMEIQKREMERLLKRPSQFMQTFASVLTDIEWKVAILNWDHQWKKAQIARVMDRDRSTISETLARAGKKMNQHGQNTKSKGIKSPD